MNPAPTDLQNDTTISSQASDNMEEAAIMNHFSIVHYNIQSISNKVDLIGPELKRFDIICLTETWLNQGVSDDSVTREGYKLYRRDREEGIVMEVYVFTQKAMYIHAADQILNLQI